eukprot:scaffold167533_cov36-Cyclotella_meneghiniana.AAC.1
MPPLRASALAALIQLLSPAQSRPRLSTSEWTGMGWWAGLSPPYGKLRQREVHEDLIKYATNNRDAIGGIGGQQRRISNNHP